MSLLEPNGQQLAEVRRVPAERCAAEPSPVIDQEQDELEGLGRLSWYAPGYARNVHFWHSWHR